MISEGMLVTRNSYNNDIVFKVIKIVDNIAYLKGEDVRLSADSLLDDLRITDCCDYFEPEFKDDMDRCEYLYLPGKILHIDADIDYLNKSLNYYKKCGVLAIGKLINEEDIPNQIENILKEYSPDIVVITGHDACYSKKDNKYKNSSYFIDAVKLARKYEKSHEKLVIIAGACQSDYENLIRSGANFASSPKRINIHALDPAIIAVNIALSDKSKLIDIKNLLNKTKNGKDGIGGIVGNGMMHIGYPR